MVETRRHAAGADMDGRFSSIYEKHRHDVWLYCRRRIGADGVDDAVADVFLAVWRRIDDAPQINDVLPWLYRVCYLTVSNHWRGLARRARLRAKVSSAATPVSALVDEQIVHRAEVSLVVSLLDEMRPADAEVLRLSVWEGLDVSEVATVIGVSDDAARQRLSRARRRLTDLYMKKQGGER